MWVSTGVVCYTVPMKQRVFTAIQVTQTVASDIENILTPFRSRTKGLLQWHPAQNWHVTLNFLGEQEEADIAQISALVAPIIAAQNYFNIYFDHLEPFPPIKNPTMIVAGMVKNRNLFDLQYALRTALDPYLPPQTKRPFLPHTTLAKIVPRADQRRITEQARGVVFKRRLEVTEVVLLATMRTHNNPSWFKVIEEYKLRRIEKVEEE